MPIFMMCHYVQKRNSYNNRIDNRVHIIMCTFLHMMHDIYFMCVLWKHARILYVLIFVVYIYIYIHESFSCIYNFLYMRKCLFMYLYICMYYLSIYMFNFAGHYIAQALRLLFHSLFHLHCGKWFRFSNHRVIIVYWYTLQQHSEHPNWLHMFLWTFLPLVHLVAKKFNHYLFVSFC